jgi:hypothetical protein
MAMTKKSCESDDWSLIVQMGINWEPKFGVNLLNFIPRKY